MKVAAIIAGETRHFWFSIPSILRHVIDPNNIDCYFYLSKNSNYDYAKPLDKYFKMPEAEIITDCFSGHVKEFSFDNNLLHDEKLHYINEFNRRVSVIDIKDYAKNFWYYENGRHQKAVQFVDEWLKIKKCSELITEHYDIILRIRIDIPWLNEFKIEPTKKIKVNYDESLTTTWAKEYLFYGEAQLMKFTCENMVGYFGVNLESWRRGDEELCLVNEVQFGKFLADHSIPLEKLKEHRAGAFYNFYNVQSKYKHLSNFHTEPLVCYLDAGTVTKELDDKNIYTL